MLFELQNATHLDLILQCIDIYCASRLNGLQNPELKLEMDKDIDETTQHGVNENILNKVKLFFTFFAEGVQKET